MHNLRAVFQFGWPYLRRYWARLAAGIVLGVLFGLTNASFVWATKVLIERFQPREVARAETVAAPVTAEPAGISEKFSRQLARAKVVAYDLIDGWLPQAGEPLDWRRILGGLLLLPLLVLLRSSTDYGNTYCMGWVSTRMINDMRVDVMEKLSTLSLSYFDRSSSGDLLTRINSDTANLLQCIKKSSADLIKESITLISVLGALLWINWKLTFLAMAALPLCIFPLLVLGKKARRAGRASIKASISQAGQLVELFSNVRVIKAYHLERQQVEQFRKRSRELVRHGMKGIKAKELANPLIEVVSMLGLGALVIYIFKTETSLGDFVGLLTGLMLCYIPVKKLAGVHILFEQASVGVQRLAEIMGEQPAVQEPHRPKPLPRFREEIRFQQVSFGYDPQRPVLHDFNLIVPRGQRIGIAGPSGSGKSTVVNLLLRFYDPTQGRITIDGIDLRELSFQTLRNLMALVTQETVLFDQTIAENIAVGKPGATRSEIEAAARAAFAEEFISRLPHRYDTCVGERGITLSGGQRQRIALARAFIRDASILILDEATAALDARAEAEVQAAIERLEQDRTVIAVAHRLATLQNSDLVIFLAEGRVVEVGGFAELLHRNGAFASMARRQGITAPVEGLASSVLRE